MSIASLRASLVTLDNQVTALEASAGLQASAQDTANLTRELGRVGLTLRASSGLNKSAADLFDEISKLEIPPDRRIELKRHVERLSQGMAA